MNLTLKQREILEFIESCIEQEARSPSYREIARAFGLKAVGTIEGHLRALRQKGFLETDSIAPRARARTQSVPIVGRVPAGPPIEALNVHEGYLSFASQPGLVSGLGRDVFALKIVGLSMKGAGILDGDFVVVKKTTEVRSGEFVVALIDGEATVKEYRRVQSGVWLVPHNPDFEPQFFQDGEGLEIAGKVVGLQRFY